MNPGKGSLRVCVYVGDVRADPVIYEDISAVGVGHIKKDLVLVPADESKKPIEAGTDWTRVIINKDGGL